MTYAYSPGSVKPKKLKEENMRYLVNLLFIAVIVTSGAFIFSTQVSAQGGCTVFIEVDTVPDTNVVFPYTVVNNEPEEFELEDNVSPSQKFFLPEGELMTVTQGDVPGWLLRGIDCRAPMREVGVGEAERFIGPGVNYTASGSRLTLTCDDSGITTCTFLNAKTNAIPTISEWGMLALAAAFGIVALFAIRRRKAAA